MVQSVSDSDESHRVEEYLQNLDLDLLVIEFLEFETARELDPESRHVKATRLIDLYARRMIAESDLSKIDWQEKSELLIRTYPDLSTPMVRLAALQSRYLASETLFRQWWTEGSRDDDVPNLVLKWSAIQSDLQFLLQQLEVDYRTWSAESQSPSGRRRMALSRLAHTENLILQTHYLSGWTSYFLGKLIPEQRQALLRAADHDFREFLQIDPDKRLVEISPDWIDFSSNWNVRALAGLAMCQRGLNRIEESEFCFDLIGNHAPRQQARDLRFVWELNSRLYIDDFSSIGPFVRSVAKNDSLSEPGRILFWRTTLSSGIAIQSRSRSTSRELMRDGLRGLARDFQAPLIKLFLDENDIQANTDDFLSHWIAGYLDFHESLPSKLGSDYEPSVAHLTRAIELSDTADDPLDIVCVRYLLARIDFQKQAYEKSSTAALECSLAFGDRAPRLAVESQWLAVQALSILRQQKPRSAFLAHRAIDELLHRFPGSRFANKATFEKRRINSDGLPIENAIERFQKINPGDPNYAESRNEILKLRFQSWLDAHLAGNDPDSLKLFEFLQAEREFQRIPQSGHFTKQKSSLLVVDALLRFPEPDLDAIRKHLDAAREELDLASAVQGIGAEYHYYEFVFANRTGQSKQSEDEARWISKHARGSKFERAAVTQLARSADRAIEADSDPSDVEVSNAIALFERLVEIQGSSDESLRSETNSRIAFARLAELKIQAGQVESGTKMLESLIRIFPNHQSWIRQLANAQTTTNQFEEATILWKRLARGVEPGSDIWYESKLQLAFCVFHSGNPEQSRRLHEQTLNLSPNLPDKWRQRYDEFSRLLHSDENP